MQGTENTFEQLIDFDRLERSVEVDRHRYASAAPFPHIVLDDMLPAEVFDEACSEFPPIDESSWTSYLHVNERKYANAHPDTWGPTLQMIARDLTSDRFVRWLEQLTGHDALLADWGMDGGGLHQSYRGGYLNLHADFTSHHVNKHWRRRVNILVYLNQDWHDDWGGQLELWDADRTVCVEKVSPVGNRVVIFTTDRDSYHGHPDPMTCPDDVARQSLALYYFEEQDSPLTQSTDYRARPDDGVASGAAIYLDKKMLGAYDVVKRRLRLHDDFASHTMERMNRVRTRLFGGQTRR